MKYHLLLLLAIALAFTGCASGTSATLAKTDSRQSAPYESSAAAASSDQASAQLAQDVTATGPACKVVRVVDGDTVVVLVEGKETKVRLIGVDTPETVHPQKAVEAYGKEASRFTKNLLEGESVYLGYEAGASKLDKYGRTLAYLYRVPDRLFVNQEIIRQGYGHAYTKYPFKYLESFRDSERAAQDAGKGLWGEGATIVTDARTLAVPPSPPQAAIPSRATVSTEAIQRPAVPPTTRTREATVYVTRTGAKYHRDGCQYLSRSRIPMSLSEARQSYSPCSVCRPPQ